MAAEDSVLSRINASDLFSVLPAGLFVVMLITLCVAACWLEDTGGGQQSAASQPVSSSQEATSKGDRLLGVLKSFPAASAAAAAVLVLFAAYLAGNIIRAFSVDAAERAAWPVRAFWDGMRWVLKRLKAACLRVWDHAPHPAEPPEKAGLREKFPFPDMLTKTYAKLRARPALFKPRHLYRAKQVARTTEDVFNGWKAELCMGSEQGFAYYDTFETRVRFTASMVWAGMGGVLLSLIPFYCCKCHLLASWMCAISAVMYCTFGIYLRNLREHEVRALFFLYLAMTPKKE